ncbi:hypothetical protein O181_063635 [Austropuccinia psidii MF-1]|uniref:Uncharacterized protein n=1 Tax=Austropuccinia psidii MF-1 TaxID=1389203 RepID=A0A9Q3EJ45_9BASI|nr:hypothetical protein [Austropuccinia psidii MF-1]
MNQPSTSDLPPFPEDTVEEQYAEESDEEDQTLQIQSLIKKIQVSFLTQSKKKGKRKQSEPFTPGGPRGGLGEAEDEEGEESEETEVAAALAGAPETSEAVILAYSNQPLVSQAESNFLKMMEQMTEFMGQLTQAVAHRDNSKSPAFKTPLLKAPDSFYGIQAHKLRGFIQSCQLIFHNDTANFFSARKKVLYSTSFLTGRPGRWIEP